MILPIFLYGSEVWGAYKHDQFQDSHEWDKSAIEMVRTRFIRRLFETNKSANNMVRRETGRYPLNILLKIRTI